MLPKALQINIEDTRSLKELPNSVWRFFAVLSGPYKWPLILLFSLHSVSYVLISIIPLFIKYIVDGFAASTPETVWQNLGPTLLVGFVLCILLQPILMRIAGFYKGYCMPRMAGSIRTEIAAYMQNHSWTYYQNDFAGRLSSKVTETPKAIRRVWNNAVDPVIGSFTNFVSSLVLAFMAHEVFGFLYIAWILVFAFFTMKFVPTVQKLSNTASDTGSIMQGRFVDVISNILLVKLFARKSYEMVHLKSTIHDTAHAYNVFNYKIEWFWAFLEIMSVIFIAICTVFCVYGWQHGWLTTGDVAMLLPLVVTTVNYAWWLSGILTEVFENIGVVEEGMQAIVRPQKHADGQEESLDVSGGEIVFEDVSFGYKTDNEVLDGFKLTIPAGQKVGLVGHSGAGKTTLVNLLLGLFDVSKGEITIDGQNVAGVTEESLRENISLIPQDTTLFHRTLFENIAYGRPDASPEEVQDAAAKAYASEFIGSLDKGYQSMGGERGLKLSGGQRQRIAMARAILKDAPILILDEATSALDSASERYIQKSLETLMEDKTVIAVAHRLSTLAQMDRILVMDKGQIVEDGSHKQLLAKKGAYARLWAMQSEGFLPE